MEYQIERKSVYSTPSSYLEKSRNVKSPFYHRELTRSLEEAASDSESAGKPINTLESMISDKAKSLKACVNAILEEIELRRDLNKYQFGKIDGELCCLRTRLMGYKALKDQFESPIAIPRSVMEARGRVESNVFELERERRREGLECWRDLMGLKRYLMVALKDYWELVRRRGVLEKE